MIREPNGFDEESLCQPTRGRSPFQFDVSIHPFDLARLQTHHCGDLAGRDIVFPSPQH